jgi:hypothetical protein
VGLIFPQQSSPRPRSALPAAGVGQDRDKGFQDSDLRSLGESLQPGTSAIIAVAEDHMIERLQQGIEGYQKIARHAVSAEAAALIVAEVDEPTGALPGVRFGPVGLSEDRARSRPARPGLRSGKRAVRYRDTGRTDARPDRA